MLTKTIASSRKDLKNLFDEQKNILFPPKNGLVKYQSLDITLLYKIFKCVLHEQIEPNSKKNKRWEGNPDVSDTSLLAAIKRIRNCRNSSFAHTSSPQIDDATFNDIWTEVENAIGKISEHLDPSQKNYKETIKKLKTTPIDPGLYENLQEKFNLEKEIHDLIELGKTGNIGLFLKECTCRDTN